MVRDRVRQPTQETIMIKKRSRLQINDIAETRRRLGEIELSEAKLKLVSVNP